MRSRAEPGFLGGLKNLLFAFGIFGLVIWPAAAWLSYELVVDETENLRGIHVNSSTVIGRDFVNIWHGGGEAMRAGADAVYDRDAYRRTLAAAVSARGVYAYSYPPHMLLLSVPFGLIGYVPALTLWSVAGLVLFGLAARPWLRDVGLPGWSVLVLPGTVVNLWAGHFGFLIGALALYGWRHAETRPVRAGLAFALLTVKPHLGILIPPLLIMKRRWSVIAAAAAGTGALILLSAWVFGIESWAIWLSSTLAFQSSLIEVVPGREFLYMMPTVNRMVSAWGGSAAMVLTGQVIAMIFALAILLWAHLRGVGLHDLGLLSFAAIALVLPYIFHYDLVAMSLFALIAAARWPARWYNPDRLILGAAFLVPLAQAPLAHADIWVSPLAIAALLGLGSWRMVRDAARGAP